VALVPGTGVVYTISTALGGGRRAGLYAAGGCTLGIVPHIGAALVGLSGVLQAGAAAFETLRWLGVAYLLVIGVSLARDPTALGLDDAAGPAGSAVRIVRRGVLLNLLNPKLTLFFFAFLPQFVELGRGHVAMQITLLGVIFAVLGFCTDSAWALLAGTAGGWLKRSRGYLRFERYGSGILFIGLGLVAAFSGAEKK
jgi:threonine/homoserine/homoserine lactone efflux protein